MAGIGCMVPIIPCPYVQPGFKKSGFHGALSFDQIAVKRLLRHIRYLFRSENNRVLHNFIVKIRNLPPAKAAFCCLLSGPFTPWNRGNYKGYRHFSPLVILRNLFMSYYGKSERERSPILEKGNFDLASIADLSKTLSSRPCLPPIYRITTPPLPPSLLHFWFFPHQTTNTFSPFLSSN